MKPSTALNVILAASFISFLFSISLWFGVFGEANTDAGLFVGIWVPSILALGNLLAPRGGR